MLNNISISLIIMSISTKIFFLVTSLLFHYAVFLLVSLGFFGISIKKKFIYILNRINLSMLFYLFIIIILFILLKIYLHKNVIYLDVGEIKMVIDNQMVSIKGQLVKDLIDNFGPLTTFVAGARISATLLAKHNIGFLPKIGYIAFGGTTLAINYKLFNSVWPPNVNTDGTVAVTGPTHIEATIEGSLTDFAKVAKDLAKPKTDSISNNYNLAFNSSHLEIQPTFLNNKNPLTMKYLLDPVEWKGTLSVTSDIQKVNVDWSKPSPMYNAELKSNLQTFIGCPLEKNENFILEIVTNSLALEFTKIYFLITLLVILACKLLIKSDSIQFEFLKKYTIGRYINTFLVKYINIWQKSSNIWIFLAIIILLISSITTFLTLNKLRLLLLS